MRRACELHRIFASSEYLMNHGMGPHLMTAWSIKSSYVARTSTLPAHFFFFLKSLFLISCCCCHHCYCPIHIHIFISLSLPFLFLPFFFFFFGPCLFLCFLGLHFSSLLKVIGVSKSDSFMTFVLYIYICQAISSLLLFLVHTFSLGKR